MIYHIGRAEIELNIAALDNLTDYYESVEKLASAVQEDGEANLAYVIRTGKAMLQFFDTVCGEGTAKAAFGEHVDIRELYKAYYQFIADVKTQMDAIAQDMEAYAAGQTHPVRLEAVPSQTAKKAVIVNEIN